MSFRIRIRRRWSGVVLKSLETRWIWKVFAPSWVNPSSMLLRRTPTAVITAMIEKIPTTIPRSVRTERNLLDRMAERAMFRLSRRLESSRTNLLIAERLHRVHPCGAIRREEPGDHPDDERDQDRDADRRERHRRRQQECVDNQTERECDRQSDQPSDETEGGRLDEKLEEDRPPVRANRLPDPDLPGPFRDRHEHDIHDPDP